MSSLWWGGAGYGRHLGGGTAMGEGVVGRGHALGERHRGVGTRGLGLADEPGRRRVGPERGQLAVETGAYGLNAGPAQEGRSKRFGLGELDDRRGGPVESG